MKRLAPMDFIFVLLEKRNQPLHVAYLNLYTPPPDAPPDFARRLIDRLRSHATPLPPFNQRLKRYFGAAYWIDDPDFDIDQHVIHIAMPKPGRISDLQAMVSRMHASHLDRAYPLWRTYVIEGIEGGRIATYSKVHHAVADGLAGTRLMLKSLSTDPDACVPPVWALPPSGPRKRARLITAPVSSAAKWVTRVRSGIGSLPVISRELRQSWREYQERHPDFVSGFSAPPSILNQRISGSRRYVAGSFARSRVCKAGRALGYSVNDIVLGMCSHALRKYLLAMDALPDKPLISLMPMSTRRDRSDTGNQLAFLLANLGTHLSGPLQRLRTIKGSVDHSKRRAANMRSSEMLGYGMALMGPGMINMMINPDARWLPFNLIITNVPGPRHDLYWQGCKLEGMYPVTVVTDGMALNITLTRRDQSLDFGLIACRRTLPGIRRLLDYLEEGLVEIEALARSRALEEVADTSLPKNQSLKAPPTGAKIDRNVMRRRQRFACGGDSVSTSTRAPAVGSRE